MKIFEQYVCGIIIAYHIVITLYRPSTILLAAWLGRRNIWIISSYDISYIYRMVASFGKFDLVAEWAIGIATA